MLVSSQYVTSLLGDSVESETISGFNSTGSITSLNGTETDVEGESGSSVSIRKGFKNISSVT